MGIEESRNNTVSNPAKATLIRAEKKPGPERNKHDPKRDRMSCLDDVSMGVDLVSLVASLAVKVVWARLLPCATAVVGRERMPRYISYDQHRYAVVVNARMGSVKRKNRRGRCKAEAAR